MQIFFHEFCKNAANPFLLIVIIKEIRRFCEIRLNQRFEEIVIKSFLFFFLPHFAEEIGEAMSVNWQNIRRKRMKPIYVLGLF